MLRGCLLGGKQDAALHVADFPLDLLAPLQKALPPALQARGGVGGRAGGGVCGHVGAWGRAGGRVRECGGVGGRAGAWVWVKGCAGVRARLGSRRLCKGGGGGSTITGV